MKIKVVTILLCSSLTLAAFTLNGIDRILPVDPENKSVIDAIYTIPDSFIITKTYQQWDTQTKNATTYGLKKDSGDAKKLSKFIEEKVGALKTLGEKLRRNSEITPQERATLESDKQLISQKRKSLKTSIEKIKKSRILFKEKRWALERFYALLDILEDAAAQIEKEIERKA